MTRLNKDSSDGASYIELAQALRGTGNGPTVARDLEQLFRRVAFNVAIGNRDDHLRNHGFILSNGGWQLSPAFDLNPNVDKTEHVLAIDDADPRPSLATVLSTAAFYDLTKDAAAQVIEEVAEAVKPWRKVARDYGISAVDIETTAVAFSAIEEAGCSSASTPAATKRP
jgi:serine/threonine-protein kinase HipA